MIGKKMPKNTKIVPEMIPKGSQNPPTSRKNALKINQKTRFEKIRKNCLSGKSAGEPGATRTIKNPAEHCMKTTFKKGNFRK